jgi:hypothetical protein
MILLNLQAEIHQLPPREIRTTLILHHDPALVHHLREGGPFPHDGKRAFLQNTRIQKLGEIDLLFTLI